MGRILKKEKIPKSRSPEALKNLLPQNHAEMFQEALDALDSKSRSLLKRTFAGIHKMEWNPLATRMSEAPLERLPHYMNILGAYLPPAMRERISNPPIKRGRIAMKECEAPDKAANTSTQATADEFHTGFARLPAELRHKIETYFIQSCFAQGYIFPDQKPDINGLHKFQGEFFESMRFDVFKGLNIASYDFYSPQFWNGCFVVGPGPARQSMQWLQRMDESVRNRVQHAHISFDIIDYTLGDETKGAEYRGWDLHQRQQNVDAVRLIKEYDEETSLHDGRLLDIWSEKLHILAEINLKSLVIDMRNARGVDGTYLPTRPGVHMPRLFRTKRRSVKVLADTDGTASVYSVFYNA